MKIRYDQLTYRDQYGKWQFDRWFAEIDYFNREVVAREIQSKFEFIELSNGIDKAIAAYEKSVADAEDDVDLSVMDGISFEKLVSSRMRGLGFDVREIGQAGDQGVDLIVERDTKVIAIQCKAHSKPVGNSAVQEVSSESGTHGDLIARGGLYARLAALQFGSEAA